MSKKKKRLKYKQYQRSLQSSRDWALQLMSIEDSLSSISDRINNPLSKYITLAANDCGYEGTAEELIVSYVNPLFLQAHSAASKLDNPGWHKVVDPQVGTYLLAGTPRRCIPAGTPSQCIPAGNIPAKAPKTLSHF